MVLDPTLLLSIDEWKQLYSKEKAPCSEPYIFCYFLGIKEWHRKKVYDYAKKNNYKLVILSNDLSSRKYADVFYEQMGPKKFLKSIESASVVFTDSYHGTLFSLLYEKIFYVFNRFDDDDKICQNSRIDNISELFSIENQRIKSFDDECFCLPNYREIKNKLNELKKDSFDYLNDALHI